MSAAVRRAAWVLAAALAGCGCAGSAAAQQPEPAAELGKPVAPFSLTAEPLGPAQVGVPFTLKIAVSTRAPLEHIEVQVAADPGLSLDPAGLALTAASAGPALPAEWRITAVPVEAGVHRLRLFGEAQTGGTQQARSTVATIRVEAGTPAVRDSGGRSAAPESGSPAVDGAADGERVIRLPAVSPP